MGGHITGNCIFGASLSKPHTSENKPPRRPTKTRRQVYNNQCVGSLVKVVIVKVVITNSTY